MKLDPNMLSLLAGLPKVQKPTRANLGTLLGAAKARSELTLAASRYRIRSELGKTATGRITEGRELPEPDQLSLADGRQLNAAIVYNDLRGFTEMVRSNRKAITLLVLDSFVSEMTRITTLCKGAVVDCAGDRIMSVFARPSSDRSIQPIHDAVRCAFWMQSVVHNALNAILAQHQLPPLSCGIGIDYGEVIVARVGVRNRNKLVFIGNAANWAAKLQDLAKDFETILSASVFKHRPPFMTAQNNWFFNPEPSASIPYWYRSNCIFKGDSLA